MYRQVSSKRNLFVFFLKQVWCLKSCSRIFHSYGDVTIAGERLQTSTYARHPLSLSSEGFQAFRPYCDTEHRFRMAISEYTWHSHILLNVHHWRCHCFYDLSLSRLGFENPTLRLRGGRSNPLRHRSGCFKMEISSCSKVTGPQFAVVYSLYKGNIFEWDMKQLTIQAINTQ